MYSKTCNSRNQRVEGEIKDEAFAKNVLAPGTPVHGRDAHTFCRRMYQYND